MAAHKRSSTTSFLGTSLALSRQFRTLLSPPPSSPPPLNRVQKILVIADPASGKWFGKDLALPRARQEGFAVVEVLNRARKLWEREYDFRVTVRIGPRNNSGELDKLFENLRQQGSWIESADYCDPLKLAVLIVNEHFDVIHYAGHGAVDGKRAGWVLDQDCFLSAHEIFRVRQVPRLVFANACFSAVTSNRNEQRGQLVGLAQAFFARGIPNYVGTGWEVNDACARECARWFYSGVFGLRHLTRGDAKVLTAPPATIGESLLEARRAVFNFRKESSSWGAYQHYGKVSDKLLPLRNVNKTASEETKQPDSISIASSAGVGVTVNLNDPRPQNSTPEESGAREGMDTNAVDLVYLNGIDTQTGTYAVPPFLIEELAQRVRGSPCADSAAESQAERSRFIAPHGRDLADTAQSGWAVVFPEGVARQVRDALAPLLEHRRKRAGKLFKILDYKSGEKLRDWYIRHQVGPGTFDPDAVPYYLLLVGPPTAIPFDFQFLLGVEYAVGRLSFNTAEAYAQYARSVVAYDTAAAVSNRREIVYWATRHPNDPATNLSASLLVEPLANGLPDGPTELRQPVHSTVGYSQKLYSGHDAVREVLLGTLRSDKPPAALFTASHGMSVNSGLPSQLTDNGALLCQDWPGFGPVRPDHYLAASDVPDDANVSGLVAFLFACFGGGTPDKDQFLTSFASDCSAPPIAPHPFVAALPTRLLSHPRGAALAVIAHVDRAWGFSIRPPKLKGTQIGPFRNTLAYVLEGSPVGHAVGQYFGERFSALSAALLSSVAPTAPELMRLSDRDLVNCWLERNDAQNYVVLGDPAVRIRRNALA
jgi:hypothetical protein